jgi:diguanylate cyclase (GGDEF)-like protein
MVRSLVQIQAELSAGPSRISPQLPIRVVMAAERTMRSSDPPGAVAEKERLVAVEATGLLDEPGRERDALDRLARLGARLTGADAATVTLVDRNRQCFVGAAGLEGEDALRRESGLDHSYSKHVVRHLDELVTGDARDDPLLRESPAANDMVAYAGIPLVTSEGAVLGSLSARSSQPREWSKDDLHALRELAAVCSHEIELVQASNLRAESALRDDLTGLPTRALAAERLRTALGRARYDEGEAAVLYVDLDGFEAMNEDLGPAVGEEVLKMAARRLEEGVRAGDTVARCGRDEFMVVCEDVDVDRTQLIVACLAATLGARLGVPGLEHGVRASIGFALGDDGLGPYELMRRAARATHEAPADRFSARAQGAPPVLRLASAPSRDPE